MIVFRQKDFTIQEGHYTGPKDMDKVPGAIEVIGKSALAGTGIGGLIGGVVKDQSVLGGAITGGKYGTITGVILKFFLNYLHNPMSSVKYQEVDKLIRREFGIYRMSGITVGDSVDKRANLDEKFSFNDRNVTDYKINFSIQNDSVTLYTLGLTDKELDQTSKILDYYCKKYVSMEYNSIALNPKVNAYSVSIVFTNYQVIANFIMELSNTLKTKINLLDNKALVDVRFRQKFEGIEEKAFSVKSLNKYDLIKIIGGHSIPSAIAGAPRNYKEAISEGIMGLIVGAVEKFGLDVLAKETNLPLARDNFNNTYLENRLKKMHYVENFDYTVGEIGQELNMSLNSGLFIVTVAKSEKETVDSLDKSLWKKDNKFNRSDVGNVIVYTYPLKSKNDFDYVLKRFMSLDLKPNIFQG